MEPKLQNENPIYNSKNKRHNALIKVLQKIQPKHVHTQSTLAKKILVSSLIYFEKNSTDQLDKELNTKNSNLNSKGSEFRPRAGIRIR